MEPIPQNPIDVGPRYNEAVANRDVKALTSIAKDTVGTPASEIAINAAKIIKRNTEEFGKMVEPLEKSGGPNTPEGRLKAVELFKTTADNPRWGTALIKYILGDQAGAVKQITGGDVTKKITYTNNGDQIEETVNQLGEALSYLDRKTGRNITKEEYAQRVGGISSWDNTLEGKSQTLLRTKSTEALAKDEESSNHWFGLTQAHKPAWQEIYNTLRQYKTDIPSDLYNKIIRSTASSLGQASSSSRGSQILDQLNKTVTQGENTQVSQELASALGFEKGVNVFVRGKKLVSADGKISKEIGALQQTLSSANVSNEAQNNASMTRDSILEAEKLKQLSPEAAQRLKRVIEVSQQIGKETLDAVEKYGKPSFISLPTAANIENKQAQVLAQALQGMHNAEQMGSYIQYRRDALEGYKSANQVPLPGAIAAGYARTPLYQDLRTFFADNIEKVMGERYEPQTKQPAKASGGAAKPPAAQPGARQPAAAQQALPRGVPAGSTLSNLRTPDGRKLWRDPQGNLHTED